MPSEVKMPVWAWLVAGGERYLDVPYTSKATAQVIASGRKDGSAVEPLVRQSDALAYADAKVKAALERLETELDALREDAARYRWLRDVANNVPGRAPIAVMTDSSFKVTWKDARYGPDLDAAIDAARKGSP